MDLGEIRKEVEQRIAAESEILVLTPALAAGGIPPQSLLAHYILRPTKKGLQYDERVSKGIFG
jgi:hypothetical protein